MAHPIDRTAVDGLVVEHLPAAMRLALRLSRDANTAEEVVQEALCLVLRRWRSYRGEAAFRTWMLQIVVNVDRDRRRRQKDTDPMPVDQIVAKETTPFDQIAAEEVQEAVRTAINRLPQRQREVAILSVSEGLQAIEVAQILDTTEANVHTCLHLARKKIAQAIGLDYSRRESS